MKIYFRDCPKLREVYSYNDEEELFLGVEIIDGSYRWFAENSTITEMLSWRSLLRPSHMLDFLKKNYPEVLI